MKDISYLPGFFWSSLISQEDGSVSDTTLGNAGSFIVSSEGMFLVIIVGKTFVAMGKTECFVTVGKGVSFAVTGNTFYHTIVASIGKREGPLIADQGAGLAYTSVGWCG